MFVNTKTRKKNSIFSYVFDLLLTIYVEKAPLITMESGVVKKT